MLNQISLKLDAKSLRQYKSIGIIFVCKGLYAGISLLMVPLLINQISAYQYGIFTTIVTATTWLSLFDGGISNGAKNKLTEAIAKGDFFIARQIISTVYITLLIVSIIFIFLLLVSTSWIDWNRVFNASKENSVAVNFIFILGGSFFLLRIASELIYVVLQAHQKSEVASLIQLVSQSLVYLWMVSIKYFYNSKDLRVYASGYYVIPVVGILAFTIFLFLTKYKNISPTFSCFNLKNQKDLFKLSGNFFVIQIAAIIIFTTDSLIISKYFNYEEVAKYNVAYRYFGLITFLHLIILTPFWTAFTDAFVRNDYTWIKKTIKHLQIIWVLIIVAGFGMLFISPYVYHLWIGKDFSTPFILNLGMFLYIIISCWNNTYVTFLNSIGKIKFQYYFSILIGILNIPLSIFLIKYTHLGPSGVIFATSACLFGGSIWAPIQYYKLINNKASGIWNR